jgi:hypothetical protein
MANEISISASLTWTKSGATISGASSSTITQVEENVLGNVQIIGTDSETIKFGDVTTPGYLFFRNRDTTNFVQIGIAEIASAANAVITLKAGEGAILPTRLTGWHAKADTAPINLLVIAIEG